MFIIAVVFNFDRFVKPATNFYTLGEGIDIYRLKIYRCQQQARDLMYTYKL
jgi:hypothetical protein